ncbi:rust resistance kinase Lr10-like [Syzygium oleosum]|uniref:rust resistance kinase Lr10-like n=1 Tax=Syzygium oleosum TaxID=219896 RepID=UPI0024B9EFA6|nr:rust resistance kinase Lr10-like [Syzygium oleosum]
MYKNQLLLLLLFLHRSFSIAIEKNRCTISCGEVTNISCPFRLRGDPKSCGDHKYELACVNNRTVLDLYSGQYYVRHIDYTNFTIRIADVGLQKGNCSSLPLRSLSCPDFWYKLDWWYECGQYTYKGLKLSKTVAIMDCTKVVDSRFNIEASSCLDGIKFLNSSSTRRRVYAMVDVNVSYVETSCTVELMAMIPWWADGNNLRSYAQIHDLMVYGFELSWLPIACKIYCKHYYECDISGKHQIPCSFKKGQIIIDYLIAIGRVTALILVCGIVPFMVVKFILGAPCVMMLLVRKWRRRHLAMDQNVEEFLQSDINFLPIRYSYLDIKKITGGLKDKLGEGGYGSVFKGRLRSGRVVAVKILKKGKANGQDFISEVATIGRIYHVNVVGLIGFCFEGSKQALVYDFMHNGSLDKHIFSRGEGTSLDCKEVYKIALGVARGIEYLHRGCDVQILHFDIKPHNILLDKDLTPKVSDFGLARLYSPDHNTVSLTAARGTLGYMAPELVYKNLGGISYKADVYSFGKLLMEMASGRKNVDADAEYSSQIYFPLWVHDQLSEASKVPVEEVSEEDKKIVKMMMIVALWCIQLNPGDRPSMHKVLEMLEGEADDLQVPPKPLFFPTEMSTRDDGTWTDKGNDTISTSTIATTYEASHLDHTNASITQAWINTNSI